MYTVVTGLTRNIDYLKVTGVLTAPARSPNEPPTKPNAAKIRIQVTGTTTAPARSPNKPLRQNAAEIRCLVTSATTAPACSPNEPLRPNLFHQKWHSLRPHPLGLQTSSLFKFVARKLRFFPSADRNSEYVLFVHASQMWLKQNPILVAKKCSNGTDSQY
ncbi:hypothetical protein NDU88_001367 [Pleurodeles waltl]|uniref:Uncharacterized protein n=1 Tax=Pleurodeles waltl TaxID=8319 RepID=A0AAV7WM44_PLEWA|nr:hypothetical protein NDU88_001367 [Pleurodeles waltl]